MKLDLDTASEEFIEKQNLCKSNYISDQNKGVSLSDSTNTYKICLQSVIGIFKVVKDTLSDNHKDEIGSLIDNLESTLNHHLYPQDFASNWY